MENENETFSTRDLYLASTLLSLKFSLAGLDMQLEGFRNAPVGYFLFQRTPELVEVERKYWSRRIALEPIEFINNLYNLKSEVMKTPNKLPRITADKRDIHFAATLLTLKFDMLNIEFKEDGYKNQLVGQFIFKESSQFEKAKEDYLSGNLAVEPILFISNLRGLKSQLTNRFKSPHAN